MPLTTETKMKKTFEFIKTYKWYFIAGGAVLVFMLAFGINAPVGFGNE